MKKRAAKKKLLVPDKLPQWFVLMAADGIVRARDVANLFGFKSGEYVSNAVRQQVFPPPDIQLKLPTRSHGVGWYKHTLAAEIRRRRNENQKLAQGD